VSKPRAFWLVLGRKRLSARIGFEYYERLMRAQSAGVHYLLAKIPIILRLAKSNRENGDLQRVLQGGSGILAKGKVSVEKGGFDVHPLAGKEELPSLPPKATTKETTPEQVDKSDKKSVGVEVKKNGPGEKGKDEIGTGVENS